MSDPGILAFCQLPLHFDAERLRTDHDRIPMAAWLAHYNTQDYEGEWSGAPLRAVGGRAGNLYADPAPREPFADTPLLEHCPYLREVLAQFRCPLLAVRLLRLKPGARIREHRDHHLGLENGEVRVHVPVTTNPDVDFVVNGVRLAMNPGEAWYVNFNLPHRVANRGATDRVHLVLDCTVNDWLRGLLPQGGVLPPEPAAGPPPAPPQKTGGFESFQQVLQEPALQPELRDVADREAVIRRKVNPLTRLDCKEGVPMTLPFTNPLTARIVEFLLGIGLPVRVGVIAEKTFLPGIRIEDGVLVIDEAQLTYPGDLLHEAGHLAVVPTAKRTASHLQVGKDGGDEMMAIAWSYAAAVHLGLDPAVVFHAGGYRGGSQALIDNFSAGRYIGVPTLQWIGLTAEPKRASEMGVPPYPHMLKWLRD